MLLINNIDLFAVGMAIASIGILGFAVFYNNPKSITNRSFLFFSAVTIVWSIFNYLNYQISSEIWTLWLIRLVVFCAVWHAFSFFQLLYVFPKEKHHFSTYYWQILLPVITLTSVLTLTPLVFSKLIELAPAGEVSRPQTEAGIAIFGAVVMSLIIDAVILLIGKLKHADIKSKSQLRYLLLGTIITFSLLLIFNFILPSVFTNVRFVPLGGVFLLPFVICTTYAIFRYNLLDIKIIATEVFAFLIVAVSFLQILTASGTSDILLGIFIFVALLIISIFLIRTVRKEVEQRAQLAVANEKLRELDVQKSEFMSLATHQLKAPLTVIKGYASMLKEGSYGAVADGGKEILDRIFSAAQHLVVIIDDFLNISRIEQGRMQYDFGPVDMRQLIAGIVNDLKQGAEQKGLSLAFDASSSVDFTIIADFGKVRQVIMNLIDNAIKFSTAGSVRVTMLKQNPEGVIRLSVSDTGIGMSAETIGKLFQRFSRAKDVGKTQVGGSGLGLYIARQMVVAHGGKIWAESGGDGKGSTFFVEFQPKPPHEGEQNVSPPT